MARKKRGKRKLPKLFACPSCRRPMRQRKPMCSRCRKAQAVAARSAGKVSAISGAAAGRIPCGNCARPNKATANCCTSCGKALTAQHAFLAADAVRRYQASRAGTPEYFAAKAARAENASEREALLAQAAQARRFLAKAAGYAGADRQALLREMRLEPDPAKAQAYWRAANAWVYDEGGAS